MKTESKTLIPLTEENFSEVKETSPVLVVKMEASWCGACKMLQPVLTELASDFAGKAIFASVDVESNPNLTLQFRVTNLPTILLFREGQLLNRHIGVVSKMVLTKDINRLLDLKAALPSA